MGTISMLLLLVMTRWIEGHVIFSKEPPRYRLAYDEWKPVREGPIRHHRYPVYHKSSSYPYVPGKKISHQTAEQSEKVEVFSPVPPTILGSFSVFGHATVNAREHASHINKKVPRPQYSDFTVAESRPKVSSYQVRHQYIPGYSNYHYGDQKHTQFSKFNDQPYYHEASLRPPPHDASKSYLHSSPSSYYSYDQNYQSEDYRKSQKVPHSSYRYPATVYSTQVNEYKTTVPPNDYDSTFSYYNSPSSNIDSEYYNENPVGAVPLSIRRPQAGIKPVTESNNIQDQLSNIGRPFQNLHSFTTAETIKGTLKPFVSTYPSSSTIETKVKFSDVAQPFRVSDYENGAIPSSKPESAPQTYTEEMYPISVTTIDVPTEEETQNVKEAYDEYNPNQTPFKPSPYDHSNHRPFKNSYDDENNAPIFLPTPSTDTSPYLSEPKSEITTIDPESIHDFQQTNIITPPENKAPEQNETPTELYTALPIETTTKYKPHKSRRPTRPTTASTTLTNSENDYKYQRRRKPSNKYRTRGSSDKYNSYKRQRTTTTPSPVDEEQIDLYTTHMPDINASANEKYEFSDDKSSKHENKNYYEEKIIRQYEDPNETRISITDEFTIPSTSSTTTSTTSIPTTVATVQTTTPVETTTASGSRVKSKYGNRPRFSIKDYRDKLNKATSTVAPHETEKTKPARNETEFKFGGRTRGTTTRTTTTTTTTETPETQKSTSEPKYQKYKPRLGTSRYKTTTTQQPETDTTTTTERANTFKPSGNRYKPGTGKYYSRYRTSTIPPKEIDDSPVTTTAKITIRPKGVFSAKRQPYPLKSKAETSKSEDDTIDEQELGKFSESLKINENEVFSAVLKKMDDSTTTTIASEEEEDELKKEVEKDPTGQESLRIADLTSSSSNDFRQSSYIKGISTSASKRPIPKITLPTDNPILPLEAFFQTQH